MTKYGGSWDAYKRWLDHEMRMRKLGGYGDIFYVDATDGDDDTGDGTLVTTPYQTLEAAIDAVTDDNGDTIICKDNETVEAGISVDKARLSILGYAIHGANPYYPEIGCFNRAVAEDAPVLTVDANNVEIAGMAFAAEWVTDNVAYQPAMRVSNGCNRPYIHHCYFPDRGRESQTVGLTIHGVHFAVIEDCTFHSIYGYMDWGLYFASGPSNPAYTQMRRLTFMGGSGAMTNGLGHAVGLATHQYWTAEDIKFLNVTNGILLGDIADLYGTVKGVVGTMAKGNIFESAAANDDSIAHLTSSWKVTAADCWGSDGPLTA